MALYDAEPRPLEYAPSARWWPPAQIAEDFGEKVGPGRRKEALVADDRLIAQTDLVNRMGVVKTISLQAVRLSQLFPALLFNENAVSKAENPIH